MSSRTYARLSLGQSENLFGHRQAYRAYGIRLGMGPYRLSFEKKKFSARSKTVYDFPLTILPEAQTTGPGLGGRKLSIHHGNSSGPELLPVFIPIWSTPPFLLLFSHILCLLFLILPSPLPFVLPSFLFCSLLSERY